MRILKSIIRDKLFLLSIKALTLKQYKTHMQAIRQTWQIGRQAK